MMTSARMPAPPTRRSIRSKVYVRSMRPLVFRVSYDDVINFQRSMRSPIHVPSTVLASRSPESGAMSGRTSASGSARVKPITRPSGAKFTRASCASLGTNARTDQKNGATSRPRTNALRESAPPPASSTNVRSESFPSK
jgi:hypothetical protein